MFPEPETKSSKDLGVGRHRENRPDYFRLWTQSPRHTGTGVLLLETQMLASAQGKAAFFQSHRHSWEVPCLSRYQHLKEEWSLKKTTFPSFTTVGDLHSINLVKLEVKWKSGSSDTQVRTACQILPVTAHAHPHLPAAHLIDMGKQPGPWQHYVLPDLSLRRLPLVGQVCFSFMTMGTSLSCKTLITKVTGLASERPVWVLVHPHGFWIIRVSSSLSLLPPLHDHVSRLPALLSSGSSTSFQSNSLS